MKKLPLQLFIKIPMLTFFFKLHDETRNSKQVGEISEQIIYGIDKFLKKTQLHQMVTYFKL